MNAGVFPALSLSAFHLRFSRIFFSYSHFWQSFQIWLKFERNHRDLFDFLSRIFPIVCSFVFFFSFVCAIWDGVTYTLIVYLCAGERIIHNSGCRLQFKLLSVITKVIPPISSSSSAPLLESNTDFMWWNVFSHKMKPIEQVETYSSSKQNKNEKNKKKQFDFQMFKFTPGQSHTHTHRWREQVFTQETSQIKKSNRN